MSGPTFELHPEWMQRGACTSADPESWFPDKSVPNQHIKAAKAICADCPVRIECLQFSLDNDERFGIWGGLTEYDRRKLRRKAS